jgi:hypothetical protein
MPEITECGSCGSSSLQVILDIGQQPLAEVMQPEVARHPLVLVECRRCTLVQLSYIADGHEMFPADHPYATGNTRFLREHFRKLANQLSQSMKLHDLVVDIGCNDGTFLRSFVAGYYRKVGVEPTDQALKAGPGVYQEFFTEKLADQIVSDVGKARFVVATNVLAHVPDPHDFLDGVATLLRPDGEFVTENHDLRSITRGLQIDTVYHEHLRYYSVASLSHLLSMHGLEVSRVEPIPTHGGSFRTFASPVSQVPLAEMALQTREHLKDILKNLPEGSRVFGIGAATRATPLLHFAGLAPYIECVCEAPSSEKIGKFMPGTRVPVVADEKLITHQPEYALLFSWHIAADLIPMLRKMGYRGQFIIPLPDPRVTDGKEFL